MGYNDCKKCGRLITRYTIDRMTEDEYIQTYYFKFCWGCGYFSIYPNIRDDFTNAIMRNKMLIIELIDQKKLKPIL